LVLLAGLGYWRFGGGGAAPKSEAATPLFLLRRAVCPRWCRKRSIEVLPFRDLSRRGSE